MLTRELSSPRAFSLCFFFRFRCYAVRCTCWDEQSNRIGRPGNGESFDALSDRYVTNGTTKAICVTKDTRIALLRRLLAPFEGALLPLKAGRRVRADVVCRGGCEKVSNVEDVPMPLALRGSKSPGCKNLECREDKHVHSCKTRGATFSRFR